MKWIKRTGLTLLLILIALLTIYFSQIIYGIQQLNGQLTIVGNAEDLDEYLADPANPDSIKNKLELIKKVKAFAVEELTLSQTDNYSTVYDQKGKDILWVVTASLPYRLEPKIWKFPFLGEVSYKGYFVLNRAIREARKLEREGWDVSVRTVTAWSTLGWFSDPVLTGMLDRSDGELAELIIHELTHGTLFVKDSVDFNENLASFIGEKGAEMFLIATFGRNSPQLAEYQNNLIDQRKITRFMLAGASRLDSLYGSFTEETDSAFKANSKKFLINEIVNNFDTLSLNDGNLHSLFQKRKPNNAYFMGFIRYKSLENEFEAILNKQFQGNLKSFLEFYRTNFPSL